MTIDPDPESRIRCRHHGDDPDCECYPECQECGTTYNPRNGHTCPGDEEMTTETENTPATIEPKSLEKQVAELTARDEVDRVERERVEAAEAERAKAEADRIEAERIERARPDREKVTAWAEATIDAIWANALEIEDAQILLAYERTRTIIDSALENLKTDIAE